MKDITGLAVLAWPLTLLILIALAFLVVIVLAVGYAKRTGRSRWSWGVGAFLLVYLPIFWDWIPTVALHQYYCAKESGFWVYKTFEQWKVENPTVTLTLEGRAISIQKEEDGYREIYQLNQRFNWVIEHHAVSRVFRVSKREEALVDTKNNEVLARLVDFSRGNQRSTGTTRFWLVSNDCNGGEMFRVQMGKLIDETYAVAKRKKNDR